MNGQQDSTVYAIDAVKNWLSKIISIMIAAMRTVTMISGTLTLLIIDVALGAVTFGLVLQHDVQVDLAFLSITISAGFIGTVISLATSATQLAMWDLILTGRLKNRSIGLTFMAVLVLLDTICDVALTSFLIYGENPLLFWPAQPDFLYYVVASLIMLLTALNEFFIAGLIEHLRK